MGFGGIEMTYYIYHETDDPEGKISKSKLLKKCIKYFFGTQYNDEIITCSHTGTYYYKSEIDSGHFYGMKVGDWDKLKQGMKSAKLRFAEMCIKDDYEEQ